MATLTQDAQEHAELLAGRLRAWREANPRGYLRDAAGALGVDELTLTWVGGDRVTTLRTDDLPALLATLPQLGAVKTMTRNDLAVIERTGRYEMPQVFGAMGQSLGEIDTRLFLRAWRHVVAVESAAGPSVRRSLQVFDGAGVSIHKLFVDDAAVPAFLNIVSTFAETVQQQPDTAAIAASPVRDDSTIDVEQLRARWDAMTDTHQFHGLLRELDVSRTRALRLAGPTRARRIGAEALEPLLTAAASTGERVMLFVGNRGMVQIYSGTIHRVLRTGGFLNVLDPGFNLHVRDDQLHEAWLVSKPTADGIVRSFEAYDAHGDTVLQVFGKRREGEAGTPAGMGRLLDDLQSRFST